MTKEEIKTLIGTMKKQTGQDVSLIETHISWVILEGSSVYKIKKPMQYSFLDYSTPEKRRYCCYKELILNRRIAREVYLEVVPVCVKNDSYYIQAKEGVIIDYAVKMKRLDQDKLMNHLLRKNEVAHHQIITLAEKIARFHHNADIIVDAFAWRSFDEKFADLGGIQEFVTKHLDGHCQAVVEKAIKKSTKFLQSHANLLNMRVREGFQRDVHGDLHAKNIFLYDDPVIFDCIEFSDDHRQMDLLNELAFCCMDLEANERHDFSKLLLETYLKYLPAIRDEAEMKLFIYFKAYRANVRAKVNALRAKQEKHPGPLKKITEAVDKYLRLMDYYLNQV